MSVVRINAIEVPEAHVAVFEQRFAERARIVETMEGFESFQLLRPTSGDTRYFVYTQWVDDAAFQQWVGSEGFRQGHASEGGEQRQPVASHSSLLQFDVIQQLTPAVDR